MNFDYICSVALLSDCDGKMSSRGVGKREREREVINCWGVEETPAPGALCLFYHPLSPSGESASGT